MANARSDAAELSVSDRVLLFCLASGTEWKRVVTQSAVTRLIVHGVIDRAAAGRLELTHKAVQCSTRCSVVTRRNERRGRRDHPGFGQSTVTTLTVRMFSRT
jgi:hypothetical protein